MFGRYGYKQHSAADTVTSNYVQHSSVVPPTEVSSASRLAALMGKFEAVYESVYTTPPAAGTNQSKVGSPRGRTVATHAIAHSDQQLMARTAAALAASYRPRIEFLLQRERNAQQLTGKEVASEKAVDRRVSPPGRDESRFSTEAYLKGRAVREADWILCCINALEQPGFYLSQVEFNMLQSSERFMVDYYGGPTTGNLSDALMVEKRPLGDVYVIRLENAEPSLTPACTGIVIVN